MLCAVDCINTRPEQAFGIDRSGSGFLLTVGIRSPFGLRKSSFSREFRTAETPAVHSMELLLFKLNVESSSTGVSANLQGVELGTRDVLVLTPAAFDSEAVFDKGTMNQFLELRGLRCGNGGEYISEFITGNLLSDIINDHLAGSCPILVTFARGRMIQKKQYHRISRFTAPGRKLADRLTLMSLSAYLILGEEQAGLICETYRVKGDDAAQNVADSLFLAQSG